MRVSQVLFATALLLAFASLSCVHATMPDEETREVAVTFVGVDWTNRDATIARMQNFLEASSIPFTIKSARLETKIRKVINYDTANRAIIGQDAQIRVRTNFEDSSDVDMTFKKKGPFKTYACNTEVYPAKKYEDDAGCKCEQDVSFLLQDQFFHNWFQHACTIDRKTTPIFSKISDVEVYYPDVVKELDLSASTALVVSSNICWYQPVFEAELDGVPIEWALVMRYTDCNVASSGSAAPITVDGEFKFDPASPASFYNKVVKFMRYAVTFQ